MNDRNPFLTSLDNDNDEAGVRARLASAHGYQESYKPLVREWLRERDEARAADSSAKRDAREERTLAIAEEANAIATNALSVANLQAMAAVAEATAAFEQARWAKWAAIIATVAAIIATIAAVK